MRVTGRTDIVVAPADLGGHWLGGRQRHAGAAERHRLAARALPDAKVILRAHRLSWRKEPTRSSLVVHGVLVTRRVGPFNVQPAARVRCGMTDVAGDPDMALSRARVSPRSSGDNPVYVGAVCRQR